MHIHDETMTSTPDADGDHGREYIVGMIRSLSALARRTREEEMAILLEAIVAAHKVREQRRR